MSVVMNILRKTGLFLVAWLTFAACNQIDDDLSDCGEDFQVDYELKLVTNMTTELKTQLNTITDVQVANALRKHLQNIFREFAHDVDLSFYDTEIDYARLHHESHIMNDNQSSYTLNLPMREYYHLAAANIADNTLVSIRDDNHYYKSHLDQLVGDTLESHNTGIFTARHYMDVKGNVNQTFNVRLYMANCAAALVVDTTGVSYRNFRTYSRGFATNFMVADSTYNYASLSPYISATPVEVEAGSPKVAFCSVNFPSRNPNGWWFKEMETNAALGKVNNTPNWLIEADTRVEGEVIPEGDNEDGEPLWEFIAFVTLEDGSITKTVLTVKEPLLAGELMIIKGKLDLEGVVHTEQTNVGVSVTLDWTPGMDFNTEL